MKDYVMSSYDVLPFKYSRWLMLSSVSLLIPSIVALQKNRYDSGLVYSVVYMSAINYWRKPIYGIRRDIDILVVRFNFIYATVNCIHKYGMSTYYWNIPISIIMMYHLGFFLHDKTPYWIMAHCSVHLLSALAMYIVI